MKNKVLSEVQHSKIVKLKSTFKDDEHIGMTLELAKGIGLEAILKSYHKVPADLVRVIVWQLIDIFEKLHDTNLVYKDLKASHVLINKTGIITLIDFGMVESVQPDGTDKLYVPAGTFHMMAPEMIELWQNSIENEGEIDREKVQGYDTKTDCYSLGVLIYELLLGHPPYGYLQATADNDERLKFFDKTRKGIEFIELSELIVEKLGKDLTETEETLIELMKHLLNHDPDKRPVLSKSNNE